MPALLLLLLLLWPALALGQDSSTELSRDGQRVLVNKDINGERWAITYDPGQRYVSGNVLLPGGGAEFVDCAITSDTPAGVDAFCYFADEVWAPVGPVFLSRAFLGNWSIGGGPNPTPTPAPPSQCANIRGLRRIFGTGPAFNCALGQCVVQPFVQQSGCTISGDFSVLMGNVHFEAQIGESGITTGTATVGGLALTIEGRGVTVLNPLGINAPGMRYFNFDYYGGATAGRGALEVPRVRPGSASQAFLDLPEDLFQ